MTTISLSKAMKSAFKTLGCDMKMDKTQDPDEIKVRKQWDEFRAFKGYWIDVTYFKHYKDKSDDLVISFDCTHNYTRIIGDLDRIPKYTKGTHNYPIAIKPSKKTKEKRYGK